MEATTRDRARTAVVARNQVFVPVDFEAVTLRDGLGVADFEWDQPTLFAWTGVTTYLAVDAISATLRAIASCAPGSEVVFSYVLPSDLLDEDDQETREILAPLTASSGEPLRSAFSPADVEALVSSCGLHTSDHPDHDELIRRYFADRADDLRPWGITRLIAAAVR
jgi:O-methyltransferase involved in polyketide biosynthesis